MTPDQWERVQVLYYACLEHEPAGRVRYLAVECPDAELRAEVEALLLAHDEAGGFLDTPALEVAAKAAAKDRAPSPVGRRIGRYLVLSRLGEGGMGEVYLADDATLARNVALKVLPAAFSRDEERVRRFEQEARAAARISHPNVCVVHEVGITEDGRPFIAMEYVEGETLRELLTRKRLATGDALELATQVAGALAAAHAAGVVHRDLKPENVVVRPDGLVKVLDFGLATIVESIPATERGDPGRGKVAVRTDPGVVMGTTSYVSPEVARGEHADRRSDVYGFGAVFYELLTGEKAFERESAIDTLHAIVHEEPSALAAASRTLPAEIETVLRRCLAKEPERRYASGGELLSALESAVDRSDASISSFARGRPSRRWLLFATVILLAAGGAWLGVGLRAREAAPEVPGARVRTVPLTALPGNESNPAFSPDGSFVAFVWGGEGDDNDDIYVKPTEGGNARRLTSDPGRDAAPAWSPDGRWLAFTRFTETERAIFTIPAFGGPESKLLTANVVGAAAPLDWSLDGKSLLYSDANAPEGGLGLYRLGVESHEVQQLTAPPAHWFGDRKPTVSPDGRSIAFVRSASGGSEDVYLMPSAGGEPTRVTFDNQPIIGLTWTPDGRSLIFSSNRGGTMGLWQISATGGEPQRLGVGSDNAIMPALSRQGNRLAYVRLGSWTSSIWRLELPGSSGRAGVRAKLLVTTAVDSGPQVSPDGKRIVFESTRSGASEIWMCDSDGSNPVQLTRFGRPATGTPRWSPDGRFVAFDTRLEEQADIYVLDVDGSTTRRLTDDLADDVVPSWSHDGRWIYFSSNRSGAFQVWKVPADGGEAVRVTDHGGFAAFESSDAKFVYFAKGMDAPGVWRVPAAGGDESMVLDKVTTGWGQWALGKGGIYFVAKRGSGGALIDYYDLSTNRVNPVTTIETLPAPDSSGLGLAPDERWLLYTQGEASGNDILLVENFTPAAPSPRTP